MNPFLLHKAADCLMRSLLVLFVVGLVLRVFAAVEPIASAILNHLI
jgi:hypothetical protein